jgi:anti-sigma factor RsiW
VSKTPNPKFLLPWYLNGTLSADERQAVEDWLLNDPQAQTQLDAWQQLRLTVEAQPQQAPSPVVKQRLLARVRAASRARRCVSRRRLAWAWGAAMALSVLVLLVVTIQPGIGLQWSLVTEDAAVVTFRVYRAPAGAQLGKADFGLLVEVPAQAGASSYTYVDTHLVPGQSYVYRVEGVGLEGQPTLSQLRPVNATSVLPLYLAILLASGLAGYGMMLVVQQGWPSRRLGLG